MIRSSFDSIRHILFFAIFICILTTNYSCFSTGAKKTQTQSIVLKPELPVSKPPALPPTPENYENPTEKKVEHKQPDTTKIKIEEKSPEALKPQKPAVIKSLVYNIAVMLPFSVADYIPNAANDSVPESSTIALEFYEGMLLSFEKLKQEGVSLQVHVYDTENNVNTVNRLLQTPELMSADLIVGPVYNRELKPVANFARQHQVYQLSPLSPSSNICHDNPWYLIANPSIEAQCAAIYQYIASGQEQKRIVTICSGKSNETGLSNLFFHFRHQSKESGLDINNIPVSQIIYANQSIAEIEQHLSPLDENMIVVTSFDPLLVYDLITKLNSLRSKYRIKLFGMPNWLNFDMVDFEYFANLNLHIPLPFWLDKQDAQYLAFKKSYLSNFKTLPSEYACRGYDTMLWLGRALYNYGKTFGTFAGELNAKGIFTDFVFEPASAHQYTSGNKLNRTDFLENKFVNIVRVNPDLSLEKVNK